MPLDLLGNKIISAGNTVDGIYKARIIRDGLICYLDTGDLNSYPGSGNTWFDLSGNGANVTKTGSPSWTTVVGATAWLFTADGQYFSGSISNFPTTVLTYEAWYLPPTSELTSTDNGCIILCIGGNAAYHSWNKGGNKMANYWYSHAPEGYHESGPTLSRNAWHYFCCVWDNRSVHQWNDGTHGTVNDVKGTSATNTTIYIGNENGTGRQLGGGLAIVRVYNRALNAYEVAENFQAQRGRFGI